MHEQLVRKLKDKTAIVAIIGMGYVGLPLMLRFNEVGYRVIGIDTDAYKVDQGSLSLEAAIRAIKAGAGVVRDDPADPLSRRAIASLSNPIQRAGWPSKSA